MYVELEEVCGAPSPFRVLELESDEVVRASETMRVQDRVLYVVSPLDLKDADESYLRAGESTVWATGPCGEAPVQVATGIEDIFTLEVWPEVVLGCEKATGNVVVIDPTGAREPHVVFPAVPNVWGGCGLNWTDFGLLSLEKHDEEFAALRLHPYPTDPWTEVAVPEVVSDPVRIGPSSGAGPGFLGNVLYTFVDEALVLTPEHDLMRIDLADGTMSTLQTAVAGFDASRDGRYLLWQDATVTGGDSEFPEGKVLLRDRSDGSEVLLGETALRLSGGALWWIESGIVQLRLARPINTQRIFFVPGLDFIDLSSQLFLNGQLADGRWLTLNFFFDGHVDAIDLAKNEPTRLFPREASVVHRDDEAVHVVEVPLCCIRGDGREQGSMWRVPLDGSAITKLAERATRAMQQLDDGRILGPIGIGARWLAALVIVEPGTLEELRIDDRVHFYSIDVSRVNDEGIVSYSVADGERSGVYLSKLPTVARTASASSPAPSEAAVGFDVVQGLDGRPVPRLRGMN
nr:hypothetical protein [Nannocystis sp.]